MHKTNNDAVFTATGAPVGRVEKIVLDPRTRSVAYAVVRGGTEAMEVPPAELRFDRVRRRFVLG